MSRSLGTALQSMLSGIRHLSCIPFYIQAWDRFDCTARFKVDVENVFYSFAWLLRGLFEVP